MASILKVYLCYLSDWKKKNQNKTKQNKTKTKVHVILSALRPLLCILHGLSTLYRCSLTTVDQIRPYHEKPFKLSHEKPYSHHNQPSQPGSAPRVSYEFPRDNKQWVLCPREFKHTKFSREHWTWRNRTRNLTHRIPTKRKCHAHWMRGAWLGPPKYLISWCKWFSDVACSLIQ